MVENLDNSCAVCKYPITDPICGKCYIKEVKVKLNDLCVHLLAIDVIVRKIKSKVLIETPNDSVCILCGKENLTLCRYCFSFILGNVLRELNLSEEFIKNLDYRIEDEMANPFFM